MSVRPPAKNARSTLIVTSGDISDVDGFLALAVYARVGADCLFVMSLPHYVGVTGEATVDDAEFEARWPGLGYAFGAEAVKDRRSAQSGEPHYEDFRRAYQERCPHEPNTVATYMHSDLAFAIAARVWAEQGAAGRLLFCVGGVNEVCPFSSKAIKDDVQTYAPILPQVPRLFCADRQGEILHMTADGEAAVVDLAFEAYERVVLDMNGSAAFARAAWWERLVARAPRLRVHSLFVMGGVRTDAPLQTMPAIPGVLNRFAGATMNQLYSPEGTARLLALAAGSDARIYVVANNAVPDFAATDALPHERALIGMQRFMRVNGLQGPFLEQLARCYYGMPAGGGTSGAAKPFDYFTALAVARVVKGHALDTQQRMLWFDSTYALTLLSARARSGERAMQEYYALLQEAARGADESRAKLATRELDVLQRVDPRMLCFPARLVQFDADVKTGAVAARELRQSGCTCW